MLLQELFTQYSDIDISHTALDEEKRKRSPAGGPGCWKGKKIHPTKPTKMKGGKRVNNCIDADSSDGK